MSGDLTSNPPLPALYWYHEFLAWAAHPAESGYVPVHPDTLRTVAKILLEHHRRPVEPEAAISALDSDDRLRRAFEDVTNLCEFAYENGFHEMGYDPVKVLRKAIERTVQDNRGLSEPPKVPHVLTQIENAMQDLPEQIGAELRDYIKGAIADYRHSLTKEESNG